MIYPACIVVGGGPGHHRAARVGHPRVRRGVRRASGRRCRRRRSSSSTCRNFTIAYFWYMAAIPVIAAVALRHVYKTEQGTPRDGPRASAGPDLRRRSSASRRSRASRARSARWSRPACRSSTRSPSPPARQATRSSSGRSSRRARASASGRTIAEPLIESKVFPPMVCQMIASARPPAPSTACCRRSPSSTRTRSTTWWRT